MQSLQLKVGHFGSQKSIAWKEEKGRRTPNYLQIDSGLPKLR
jgi:hypothetical protein